MLSVLAEEKRHRGIIRLMKRYLPGTFYIYKISLVSHVVEFLTTQGERRYCFSKVLLRLLVAHPGNCPSRGLPERATYGGGSEPPGRYGSHEGLSGTLNTGRLTELR